MTTGYDIWGVVAGVLGILGLCPMLCAVVSSQLPSTKFKILHDTMTETEFLFSTVIEEGLLQDRSYVVETEGQLSEMRSEVEDFRAATHRAASFMKEVREAAKGLSYKMSILCEEIKALRASISDTSSKERRKLQSLSHCGNMPPSVTVNDLSTPDGRDCGALVEENASDGQQYQHPASVTTPCRVSCLQPPQPICTPPCGSLYATCGRAAMITMTSDPGSSSDGDKLVDSDIKSLILAQNDCVAMVHPGDSEQRHVHALSNAPVAARTPGTFTSYAQRKQRNRPVGSTILLHRVLQRSLLVRHLPSRSSRSPLRGILVVRRIHRVDRTPSLNVIARTVMEVKDDEWENVDEAMADGTKPADSEET